MTRLIRQYDPSLPTRRRRWIFRLAHGMLGRALSIWSSVTKAVITLLDYKPNWLGRIARPIRPAGDALSDVPTATIYSISCIAWRCTAICATAGLMRLLDRHFGGVIYLFLRGMDGREEDRDLRTRPVRPLIDGLDRLLPEKLRRRPRMTFEQLLRLGGGGQRLLR